MKKALATLVVNNKYTEHFKAYCYENWQQYAKKHNYDLYIFDSLFDNSQRGLSRSPAWQKCLILNYPPLQQYDRVVWLDSDILINPESPCICSNIPIEKIGAVNEYEIPDADTYKITLQRLYRMWECNKIPFINNLTPELYYLNYGLPPRFSKVVQTGVLVLTPAIHRQVLNYVYNHYEDKGHSSWNYEMRPLSWELLKLDCVAWLDYKFNNLWSLQKAFNYPFLSDKDLFPNITILLTMCATTTFKNSYFLHFAGTMAEMKFVNTSLASVFDITPTKL